MSEQQLEKTFEPSRQVMRKDWLHNFFWGTAFIYSGVIFLLSEWDILSEDTVFPLLVFGIGVLLVADYFIRYFSSSLRSAGIAKLIIGMILALGAAQYFVSLYMWDWWPLLLIAAGIWIIWIGKRRQNNTQSTEQPTEAMPGDHQS